MVHSLIIGGTKGLGRVVARQLAARGDTVSILARSEAQETDLTAGDIKSFKADISQKDTLYPVLDNIVASRGKINYCVFLQRYRGKGDDWDGEFDTTLTATRNVVDHLTDHFSEEGDKGVVMVSSVFARYVGEGQSASYHVMKAGMDQLMKYYAINLGSKNIRSNGITPFTFLKEESKEFYMSNKPLMEMYEDLVPLRRLGTTEDSANAVEFLCSPKAAFLTGQNITVDGGLSSVWPETLVRRMKDL